MPDNRNILGVAVVGMAVRVPGAADLKSFWQTLIEGRDCISHFTDNEIDPLVPENLRRHPHFVAARGVLDQAECFDAGLFGMSANQARLLDPQQRVFLELCWQAFEHAGLDPLRSDGSIGVYAASANNTWLQALRRAMPELIEHNGEFATMLANEKDYIATRVAHQFNLKGPAIGVYTACSSSLVAIAQAWYALMNYQCDTALAGGSCVIEPQAGGYIAVTEGMESPDGSCRPFDAGASGTVFSSGGGCVVLKRLGDAIEAGDTIHAVIRGVGVNNDGAGKASFTAPNPLGQAAAIRQALAQADVTAASIGYVEGHGTGTALGDPIEVAALRDAFALAGKAASCVLGSVKGNIGHLTAAAGIVGLIKTVLCLERGKIPPTAHFHNPNPGIDFAATPFKVTGEVHDWPRGDTPRRAGVSSFGVGGTNAHAVLEEGEAQPVSPTRRSQHILPLSANGKEELETLAQRMVTALAGPAAEPLANVAWTLAQGRRQLSLRCMVVASDATAAARQLEQPLHIKRSASASRQIWLFPGQGSQYPGMAAALWREEPDFRATLEPLLASADSIDGELRSLLLDANPNDDEAAARLAQTQRSQPALFLVTYAMARTLQAYGLEPDAMIGHSIGEYVAACLAGVFSPEQTLKLVARRGALMQAQPPGDMVAIHSAVEGLLPHLTEGVAIACYNAESLQVVSGSHDAMQIQLGELEKLDLHYRPLKVSHAFHSPMMEGALPEFTKAVAAATPTPPRRSFYACPYGQPITAEQTTDPDYWSEQIRLPVRFADSLQHALSNDGSSLLMEIGPGHALSTLARAARGVCGEKPRAVITFGASADGKQGNGEEAFAKALGEAWTLGANVVLGHRYEGERRRHVPLPTYPFRRDHYGYARHSASGDPTQPTAEPETPRSTTVGDNDDSATAAIMTLLAAVSGEPVESIDRGQNFVALGLDSLLLAQFSLALEQKLGLKLRYRRLLEDLNTPEKLAAHAHIQLPETTWATPEPATPAPSPASSTPIEESALVAASADSPGIQALLSSQLQLLDQQAQLLRGLVGRTQAIPTAPGTTTAPTPSQSTVPPQHDVEPVMGNRCRSAGFGASARISLEHGVELDLEQQRWLDDFIARYTRRTSASRSFTQRHRRVMADPRVVTGFDPRWKEMVYPIVVDRSRDARLWDIDGNEYIDLLNGFGSNFLGYQPPFIAEALQTQIDAGYEIGPQHPLAAEVSELIAGFTGLPRVALCNTGSEAVMGAMRIARTVTGRETIVIFRDSYHGIFDEAVVRSTSRFEARPAAPGINRSAVRHMLVLDYGSDEALDILRQRGGELAAIMIEPIQARHPELRPRAFVEALRELSDQAGCALIFDEVITGFRVEQGGAQAYFGVKADIATYGKIIGGGLPFAAIAGQAHWMDALDGGDWRFGDDSQPEAGVTYFAGTFVRHPLALAAARASLKHLEEAGPGLQKELNRQTEDLTERLNRHFRDRHAPVAAVSFSSMWRLRIDDDQQLASLLFYLLRYRGLHLYEQFGCFLSTAHGEAEIEQIATRIEQAVDELLAIGLLRTRSGQDAAAPEHGQAVQPEPTTPEMSRPQASAVRTRQDDWNDRIRELHQSAAAPFALPLTEAQREIWFGTQMGDVASIAFNESFSVDLEGELETKALIEAIGLVYRRHEAHHLRFADSGDHQMLVAPTSLDVRWVDLHEFGKAEQQQRLEDLILREAYEPFDLGAGPLQRATLIRLAPTSHVLLSTAHHIVFDGWSAGVFLEEIETAYNAITKDRTPVLPPAPSFIRYVQEELAYSESPEAKEELRWWQSQFDHRPPLLDLPTDHPRPIPRSYRADTVHYEFGAETLAAAREAARVQGVTPYVWMLATYAALLHRLSDQDDLVIGIPVACQSVLGCENLVGQCVNVLPLRVAIDRELSFQTFILRVQQALLDAREHQRATLGSILRVTGIGREPDRSPLVQVTFNLNRRLPGPGFRGIESRVRENRKAGINWDMFMDMTEENDRMTVDLDFNCDIYDGETIRTWLGLYETLMVDAARRPDTELAQLSMLNDETAGWLAAQGEGPRLAEAGPDTVPALFAQSLSRYAGKTALRHRGQSLSYAELDRASRQIAASLAMAGIKPGDRVALLLSPGFELIAAMLGVMRQRGAYLPLDPSQPASRNRRIVEDAEPAAVIADVPAQFEGWGFQGKVLDAASIGVETDPENEPEIEGETGDLAYVIYTSGSTGTPKGVAITQGALVNLLRAMARAPGMDESDCILSLATASFDMSVPELFLALTVGGQIVIADEADTRDPALLCRLIAEGGVTLMQATPGTWRMMLTVDDWPESLRKLICGAEALPADLARALLQCGNELWNLYGPTETTVWSTRHRVRKEDLRHPTVPIGRPLENTRVAVLDAAGEPVPPTVSGELVIGGAGVAQGYLGQESLEAEVFIADPAGGRRYRTGDSARWRTDGTLEYLGRRDGQLKVRGFRIEPGEIETVARTVAGVRDAAVAVQEVAPGDERLVLYAVGGNDRGTVPLREKLARQLPHYMQPQHIMWLDTLPISPNGKLDRRALPAPENIHTTAERVAPRSESEALVVAAFNEVFKRSNVDVFDDFFALGGHSLLAAHLIVNLRAATKVDLPLRNLFEHPTPEGLAAAIDALAWTTAEPGHKRVDDDEKREEFEL